MSTPVDAGAEEFVMQNLRCLKRSLGSVLSSSEGLHRQTGFDLQGSFAFDLTQVVFCSPNFCAQEWPEVMWWKGAAAHRYAAHDGL